MIIVAYNLVTPPQSVKFHVDMGGVDLTLTGFCKSILHVHDRFDVYNNNATFSLYSCYFSLDCRV
jgi:hypothetical protein